MTTKILLNKRLFAVFVLAFALFFLWSGTARAASVFDIMFPVTELGGCEDREACKAYCDEPSHEDQCRAFAEKYGLSGGTGDGRDTDDHDKFAVILEDGGPGGCARGTDTPFRSCENYCNASANMRECVSYAKQHNLMERHELEDAEKVIRALDSGVPLPAACSDARSCGEICEAPGDVATMRQCFVFAKAAGLLPGDVDERQAEAMFKAIEEGRAPFGSPKDFEQCENPPNDAVFEKCIAFGLESGIIPPEDAELIRKTGGRGPGGCRGERECTAYCEAHHEECFAFAIKHDLISPEDKQRMEEGKIEAKRALKSAPPEVLSCIETAIGGEKLEAVKRGEGFFGPELGEIIPRCFDSVFGEEPHSGPFGNGIPPEVLNCMRGIFGDDVEARLRAGEIDPGAHDDEIHACLERELGRGYLNDHGEFERPEREALPPPSDFSRPPTPEEYERFREEYQERSPEEYQQQFNGEYREEYPEEYRGEYEDYQKPYDDFQRSYEGYEEQHDTPPPSLESSEPSGFKGAITQVASVITALFGPLLGN